MNYNPTSGYRSSYPFSKEELTETFDILDSRGSRTNVVIARDEAHRTGVWHGAFHCLIIYERGGRGWALFQKRSSNKTIAPDKYDVSVGGHYAAGETAAIAGPREITEELGLDVRFEELVPLGRRVFVYGFSPGILEHEFQDIFLLPRSVLPGALALQQEEVDAVLEMEVERGIGLFSAQLDSTEGSLYRTGAPARLVRVTAEDFVPCLDNYYLKLLLLAQRFLRNERVMLVI